MTTYRGVQTVTAREVREGFKAPVGHALYVYTSHCGMSEILGFTQDCWTVNKDRWSGSWCCHWGTEVFVLSPDMIQKTWDAKREDELAFHKRLQEVFK